jgi:hypothetical protein
VPTVPTVPTAKPSYPGFMKVAKRLITAVHDRACSLVVVINAAL